MNPINMHEMVRRDPALATLMGAIPGTSFGYSAPGGLARVAGYGPPARPAFAFGDDYGWGFGAGAPPGHHAPAHHAPAHHAPAHHAAHPAAAHAAGIAHIQAMHSTEARTLQLDPNRNSTVKVERYSFSFSPVAALVLGTPSNQGTYTQQPSASIKGQRVVMNAPAENFVFVQSLQIANVNVIIGGQEDANTYSGRSHGVVLDLPRLDPQNRATASSNYTGSLPPGFTAGASYIFVVTLQGPATLAGGYGQ
jgi:hypothetical protein